MSLDGMLQAITCVELGIAIGLTGFSLGERLVRRQALAESLSAMRRHTREAKTRGPFAVHSYGDHDPEWWVSLNGQKVWSTHWRHDGAPTLADALNGVVVDVTERATGGGQR